MSLLFRFLLFFVLSTTANILAQEVVIVTGASRGIGLAIADVLARAGYSVYAGVRDISSLQMSENLHVIPLDVTDQQSIDDAVATIMAQEGHIDVLVNNAGIMIYGSVENLTIEEAQKLFDVNFFGVMRVTQAVLPHMRNQKKGRIIQISSRSGFRPLPSLTIYSASKFALEGMSEGMAALLKPWNITVSLIEPGPVKTDLIYDSAYGSRLARKDDPFYSIFAQAGLLDSTQLGLQSADEIALLVKQVIEEDKPLFRYQTTENIKKQASLRLVDITGNTSIAEWDKLLFTP